MEELLKQFDDYQTFTRTTAIYKKDNELAYLMLGITSEVGEVADKLKKQIRDRPDQPFTDDQTLEIQKELGDVLWYLARLVDHFGLSFQDTMNLNVDKLNGRLEKNVIKGSGDNR